MYFDFKIKSAYMDYLQMGPLELLLELYLDLLLLSLNMRTNEMK